MEFWSELGQLLLLFLLSATKFLFAPSAYFSAGYSLFFTITFNAFGGICGSLFFLFFGKKVFSWWYTKFPNRQGRKFSKNSRMLAGIKRKYGVFGIALLLPFVSVPVSALITARYFSITKRVIFIYIMLCMVWSAIISLFSNELVSFIKSLF
jgi:hypothetical protein